MSLYRGRAALLPVGLLLLLLAACSGARAGTARIAGGAPAGSVTAAPSASGSAPAPAPAPASAPASEPASEPAPTAAATPSSRAAPTESTAPNYSFDYSFAVVRFGPEGIPSPAGDRTVRLDGQRACFAPMDEPVDAPADAQEVCASLPAGNVTSFAAFSPDGSSLLVVAGPDAQHDAVYVIDSASAEVRVIGQDGSVAPSADPPRWDLSSASWAVDGSGVVLVPHTDGADGPVVTADPRTGRLTEVGRLPADLANGTPSIWSTGRGLALVGSSGPDPATLWWLPAGRTAPVEIGRFPEAGGSLHLAAADPPGRIVLVCPRAADGRLGGLVAIVVETGQTSRVLKDTASCGGAVFSPDGSRAVLTAALPGGYSLLVVDVMSGRRVLTVPLPVAEPATPPYLTWKGDTVVALDTGGGWPTPSLIIALR